MLYRSNQHYCRKKLLLSFFFDNRQVLLNQLFLHVTQKKIGEFIVLQKTNGTKKT